MNRRATCRRRSASFGSLASTTWQDSCSHAGTPCGARPAIMACASSCVSARSNSAGLTSARAPACGCACRTDRPPIPVAPVSRRGTAGRIEDHRNRVGRYAPSVLPSASTTRRVSGSRGASSPCAGPSKAMLKRPSIRRSFCRLVAPIFRRAASRRSSARASAPVRRYGSAFSTSPCWLASSPNSALPPRPRLEIERALQHRPRFVVAAAQSAATPAPK